MGIGELRGQGRDVPDGLLSFIAPGHRENINFFGFINVDVDAGLAKLIEGWRPRCAPPLSPSPAPPSCSTHERGRYWGWDRNTEERAREAVLPLFRATAPEKAGCCPVCG
jgi:hypothetical protein